MAQYYDSSGNICTVKLLRFRWEVVPVHSKQELEGGFLLIRISSEIAANDCSRFMNDKTFKLYFSYGEEDPLKFYPLADCLVCPGAKGMIKLQLDLREKEYFTGLLEDTIGDHHSPVDPAVRQFVLDVMEGKKVHSVVVGHVDANMGDAIMKLTGIECTGNDIVLTADDVRHIIKRHGPNGQADHSMADIDNIARIGYILKQYDSIEWTGDVSKFHYVTKNGKQAPQLSLQKRIDGDYFIVEVASDGKRNRNVVITAYLKKRYP